MNKLLAYTLLLAGLLLPQIFISQYWAVLVVWIITGFALAAGFRRIFLTTFLVQLLIGSVLFLLWSAGATRFLLDIAVSFGLPGFLMPLFAVLFNAVNAAVNVTAGAVIARLVQRKKATPGN